MSISSSLANAISGLNVASRRAEVVSNNISNAQTEGYGRRELMTSSNWSGVQSHGIVRHVDPGLTADRRSAESQLGGDQRSAVMLGKLEAVIGVPGGEGTIADRLAAFENALVSAATDPASDLRLGAVNDAMKSVTQALHTASDAVQTLRQDADATIAFDIEALNTNLLRVEQLNANISRTRATGGDTANLFDARQQVVDDINAIVPIRELNRGNDQLGLMTSSGMILIDGKASQFDFGRTPTIEANMTLASGGLTGITRNGQPLDAENGFGRLSGGSLAAAFVQRDSTLVAAQSGLDDLAFDVVSRFADLSVDPTIGLMGLLTDAGSAAIVSNITGLSARLELNAAVDPAQGGLLSRWRDGVGAVTVGSIGNATQLESWRVALTSYGGQAVSDRAASLSETISLQRLTAEQELSFTSARWDSLHNAELATGVDTDVELQNLLLVEQAYAANAKVIQTVNAMIQQIMEI
ncbi:MAG: flagellar hook-associated protein 1 FlgK [Yoonia sp.]|jgi:flagellar hook-associated protein 1 FlgK